MRIACSAHSARAAAVVVVFILIVASVVVVALYFSFPRLSRIRILLLMPMQQTKSNSSTFTANSPQIVEALADVVVVVLSFVFLLYCTFQCHKHRRYDSSVLQLWSSCCRSNKAKEN